MKSTRRITIKRPQQPKKEESESTEIKEEIPKEDTVLTLLQKVFTIKKLPPDDLNDLINIKDKNGVKIFNLKNRNLIYEVINMYTILGLEKTRSFFLENELEKNLIFKSEIFEKDKQKEFLDADILLNRPRIRSGIGNCRRCGSDQLIVMEKQTRSADEPPTITLRCILCGASRKE